MDGLITLWAALGRVSGVALSSPLYASVSALHILGIALLVGAIVLVDLRLIGALKALDDTAVAVLRRSARAGAALAVATGLLLASARPAEYAANPVFLAKLGVVALALANAAAFEIAARRTPLPALVSSGYGRLAGALSLAGWLAVIALGRWIAFT